MTLDWIARRLQMGTWMHVSNLLRSAKKEGKADDRGFGMSLLLLVEEPIMGCGLVVFPSL